jgi:hypothetical protein
MYVPEKMPAPIAHRLHRGHVSLRHGHWGPLAMRSTRKAPGRLRSYAHRPPAYYCVHAELTQEGGVCIGGLLLHAQWALPTAHCPRALDAVPCYFLITPSDTLRHNSI